MKVRTSLDACNKGIRSSCTRRQLLLELFTGALFMLILHLYNNPNLLARDADLERTEAKKKLQHLCPIPSLFSGRWVNVSYNPPLYTPMRGENQQKTCVGFSPTETQNTYQWIPHIVQSEGCQFLDFDQDSYCQLMKNKTVAIIGDSTSYDHFLSLTHLLGVPQALPRAMRKTALQVSSVCHNTSTLIGKRDYYLRSLHEITKQFSPDVLVLNRGAHYVPDDSLLSDLKQMIFPKVRDWHHQCTLQGKECFFVWRTTVPGHPNCRQYTAPATSVQEMEALVQTSSTPQHEALNDFHWDRFKGQNDLVVNALNDSDLDHEIMDGYHVNILRPDLHRTDKAGDCLHNCLPDDNAYAWLLHHMLHVKYRTAIKSE